MPEKRCVSTFCHLICMITPLNYQASCARNLVFYFIYIALAFFLLLLANFQIPLSILNEITELGALLMSWLPSSLLTSLLLKPLCCFLQTLYTYCHILHCTSCMSNL